MDIHTFLHVVGGLWSTIGPLVGVLIGAYLQGIYNRRAKRDEYVNEDA